MGLLSIFGKGIGAMIDEAKTPQSFKMRERFENYVRECLFVNNYYDILERAYNYKLSQEYSQSSLKPDFTFRDRLTNKEFYVKTKFRTGAFNDKIVWCNDKQLVSYLDYNKEKPVFLTLGMGDDPEYPEFLSLMPLTEVENTGLFLSDAEKFEIHLHKPVSSKILWAR
jgi:hypothetical protein